MKYIVAAEIMRIGCDFEEEFEIPDEELEGLSDAAREKLEEEYAHDTLFGGGFISWGWRKAEK